MKLTKDEIKFIDNYLIKNKVKFWDVRLELLDHIVSAVEDKLENDGTSFNEALLEVHHGFGNRIHNGYTYNLDFEKALYIDNKGYKKFTFKKQKEIGKKQRRLYRKTFLPFLFSWQFLIELLTLILLTFTIYQYFGHKPALFLLLAAVAVTEFSKLALGGFKTFKNKSLNIQMTLTMVVFFTQISYWLLNVFNWYYEGSGSKPYFVLFIGMFLVFTLSRHCYNTYKKTYETYKNRYALLRS